MSTAPTPSSSAGGQEAPRPRLHSARPRIVITHEEHLAIDQAAEALREEPRLFQRGGELVWLFNEKRVRRRRGIERPQGSKRIVPLHHAQLRRLLTVHAEWVQWRLNTRKERVLRPAHPPSWAVEGLATLGSWPGIRPLEGIVEAPTLRPDGSLLDTPGYDASTGLWYEPEGTFPEIPARAMMVQSDEDGCQLRGLVDGWEEICLESGEEALSCAQVLKALEADQDSYPELRGILLNWSKDVRLPSARTVSLQLNKFRGRVAGGKKLDYATLHGNRVWFVKPVGTDRPSHLPGGLGGLGGLGGISQAILGYESSEEEVQKAWDAMREEVKGARDQGRSRGYCAK